VYTKTLWRLGAVLALALLAAVPLATATQAGREDPANRALRLRSEGLNLVGAKAAAARYHSVEQALKDGYSGVDEPCVASPGGTMGHHYVNEALMADDTIDVVRPEMLLYVPKANGRLQLVGLEYWKRDADGSLATSADRPVLFGRPFDGPLPGHTPNMPVHFDLHVWLFADNPSGLFAPFNPSLSCT
jgi:hypothetical protein